MIPDDYDVADVDEVYTVVGVVNDERASQLLVLMLRDFDIGNIKFGLVQIMMLNRLAQQHHMQYNKKLCKTLQS